MEEMTDKSTVYNVGGENELRFTVGEEVPVTLELLSGFAEIFGTELVQNKIYTFSPFSSVSLFTWKGCKVKIRGRTEKVHITADSLMMMHVNIHACLEEMRMIATSRNMKGPISLVVGPMQSGKTSLCRLLLNYAVRMGRRPLFVDLDVSRSTFSIPGTISVLAVDSQLDATNGVTQGGALSAFSFGHVHPMTNKNLYYLFVRNIGELVHSRLEKADPKIRTSGVIIDSCGFVRGEGYATITLIAYAFEIDVVFVVDDETLYSQLLIDLPLCVKVVYVPRQEDIIHMDINLRVDIQANRVWEYFYGSSSSQLRPHEIELNFSDVEIYAAERPKKTNWDVNAFKIGLDDVAVVRVPIGPELVNRIVGLSYADAFDENLLVTCVGGFVCIVNVDMERKVFTVLSPHPGPLRSKILILGGMRLRRQCNKPVVAKNVDCSLDNKLP